MLRKYAFLLIVLVIIANVGTFAMHHELDLDMEQGMEVETESENEMELSELAQHAAQFDNNVFTQFVSDDEDDERDDFDDDAQQEEERKREERERRREIRRIRAERRAKAKLARGPIYNTAGATNSSSATNGTNASNFTGSSEPRKRKHQFNKKHLDAKEKQMLHDTHRYERIARKENARAAAHRATASALRSIHEENKLQAKIARDNGKITYELRSAVDAMNSVKNDMERDSMQDDALFWDAFYGKKAHPNVTTPSIPEVIMNAQQQAESSGKKQSMVDMALPIYKVSHVASFEEAYGRAKKVPKLDDSLKEDGEKYLSYISLFN